MITYDIYNNSTPKYSTANDIQDALNTLLETEEMGILSEIGMDVSWESQTYYYTEKGTDLKETFDRLSDYGDKMWLLNLAIMQIDLQNVQVCVDIHDLIYEALFNTDLAKRIHFKKLFVDEMLRGNDKHYKNIIEDFAEELGNLDRFDSYAMIVAFQKIVQKYDSSLNGTPYGGFCYLIKNKVTNLNLKEETRLISECRAHLTAYDDFIFGLRANQALYDEQIRMHNCKIAELNAAYEEKLKCLHAVADRLGLLPALNFELKQIENK